MPVLVATPAFAHGYAGKRFFPATITTDDPFVADELSLPTVLYIKNNDEPSAKDGLRNEAETECQALQVGVALGERLGLDRSTARALMHFQRDRDLSDASIARLDYRLPADCAAR